MLELVSRNSVKTITFNGIPAYYVQEYPYFLIFAVIYRNKCAIFLIFKHEYIEIIVTVLKDNQCFTHLIKEYIMTLFGTTTYLGLKAATWMVIGKTAAVGAAAVGAVVVTKKVLQSRQYKALTGDYRLKADAIKDQINTLDESIKAVDAGADASIKKMKIKRRNLADLFGKVVDQQYFRQIEDEAVEVISSDATQAA